MQTLKDHLAVLLENLNNPDKELVEGLDLIAEKLHEYRLTHQGFIPLEIYPQTLAIGAVYTCMEVVVKVEEDGKTSYLMKYRDPETEHGWGGLYHIIGTAVRITDWPADIINRLSEEIFGAGGKIYWRDLEKIGDALYDESPTRLTLAPTPIFLLTIDRSHIKDLAGEWREYSDFDDPSIIPYHRKTLEWINEGPTRHPVVRF